MTVLVVISFTFNILTDVVARSGYYTTPIINLYRLVELTILYIFFYNAISIKAIKKSIIVAYPLVLIFWIGLMIKNWYVYEILSNFTGVTTLSFLLLIFAYFYEIVQNYKFTKLEDDANFWIASGLLISTSGKILSFIAYVLIDYGVYSIRVWALIWIMEMVFLIFLLIAFRTYLEHGNRTS